MIIPKSKDAQFLLSVAEAEKIPQLCHKEIAFFGASNVGKSSLINALCNRKNLAKTSKTPGRTQLLNFFAFPPQTILVDIPGYGFAETPHEIRKSWQNLLLGYLESRANRLKAYLLLDSRRFIRPHDIDIIHLFQQYSINFSFVFTKIDKLNREDYRNFINNVEQQFGNNCSILITSAKNREGIEVLKDNINALI